MPRKQYAIEDMQNLAVQRGGRCLSVRYLGADAKLEWACAAGHRWGMPPAKVLSGRWCAICRLDNTRRKNSPAKLRELRKIAHDHGGKCLSNLYIDSQTHLQWRCREGHEWTAAPNKIKMGRWCPRCAAAGRADQVRLKKMADMHAIAKNHGGRCLSNAFIRVYTKLAWECAEGHRWETTPHTVQAGSWCPTCAYQSSRITIEEIQAIAKAHGGKCLSEAINLVSSKLQFECKKGHRWQTTASTILNQCWCPICAYKTGADKRRLYTYMRFCEFVEARGGQVLSLESEYTNAQSVVALTCANGHHWRSRAKNIIDGSWCPACAKVVPKTLEDMWNIAERHNGKCLSKRYHNSYQKLRWECDSAHQWEATYRSARQGWCPICRNRTVKKNASSWNRYTLNTMQNLADQRGWQVLSSKYVNTRTALRWRCDRGHEVTMKPCSVLRGASCPVCCPRKHTTASMQQLAADNGGEFLSRRYTSRHIKHQWRCGEGHKWEATPASILQHHWCPTCGRQRAAEARRIKKPAKDKRAERDHSCTR